MSAFLLSVFIGACLFGLAWPLYMRLMGYDPVAQPRALRVAIVVGAEFLAGLCLLAGRLLVKRFGGALRDETPLDVWLTLLSVFIGAGIVVAWREYHLRPGLGDAKRDPIG